MNTANESMKMFFSAPWLTTFDDPPAGDPPAGDPPAGAPPAGDPPAGDPPAGDPPEGSISQDQLNTILAGEKRKFRETEQKLMAEVNALKDKTDLTGKERTDLETRMDEMRQKHLSKEELAKETADKAQREHATTVQGLTGERDLWQNRFTESTISRAITDAAHANEAYQPPQIIALLQDKTQLVEEKNADGEPTGSGKLVPQVSFQATNEAGEPITIFLGVDEAVKRMTDMDQYLNLFKGKGTGGVGGNTRVKAGNVDVARLARENPSEYKRLRKEGKI